MNEKDLSIEEKSFIVSFYPFCKHLKVRKAWQYFIEASAIAIANSNEISEETQDKRIERFFVCVRRLGDMEQFTKLFLIMVKAIKKNPRQDFLGNIYAALQLNNQSNDDYVPYQMIEKITNVDNLMTEIEENRWTKSFIDECGSGTDFIAQANLLLRNGYDYTDKVLFIGSDTNKILSLMCYIQLSLLDCAGYVVINKTKPTHQSQTTLLTHTLNPIPINGQEIWFTPYYRGNVWGYRRIVDDTE